MEILLPLPKDWQKVLNEQASDRGGTSGPNSATGSETEQADSSQGSRKGEYVDLLEYSVLYRMFAITDNQAKNLQPLTLLCNYTRKPRKGQEKI